MNAEIHYITNKEKSKDGYEWMFPIAQILNSKSLSYITRKSYYLLKHQASFSLAF